MPITRYPASRILIAPDPSDSGTTLTVQADDGDIFPTPPFKVICWPNQQLPRIGANACYLDVTAVDGDELTFTREQPTVSLYADQMIAVVQTVPVVEYGSAVVPTSLSGSTNAPFTLAWEDPAGGLGSVTGLTELAGTITANRSGTWRWIFSDAAGEVVDQNTFFCKFTPVE